MTRRLPHWLFATAILGLIPAAGSAQHPDDRAGHERPGTVSLDGTEVFQWMLHARDIRPLSNAGFHRRINRDEFADVIVIVLGDPHLAIDGRVPPNLLATAIENGGAVLIAADSDLQPQFGRRGPTVGVTGEEVFWPREPDPTVCYLGQSRCPYVVPLPPPAGAGPEWGLFAGLDHVATNQPSCLRVFRRDDFVRPLAGFPNGCQAGHGHRHLTPDTSPFAVGSSGVHPVTGQPYRLLVLSDPSVFINEMLVPLQPGAETDNAAFSNRVIQFLQEEGLHRRRHCLFIQNGRVVERFDTLETIMRPPPPPLPLPNLAAMQDKILDAANQFADKIQENDVPNKVVSRVFTWDKLALLLIPGIFLVLRMLRLVWRFRQPTDVPPAPPGGRPVVRAGAPPPPGVFDRRQRELLRRNNLYEPIRAAVREMFAAAGVAPDAGPRMPRVVITDTVRRTDLLRKALADLWKIGYGPPNVVTVQQWTGLEPLFERARQAHADGKWRFVAAEEGEA